MKKLKIFIALAILCLSLGVKAQDKPKAPRFDLPPNIKAILADTTAIKANIAEIDSLVKTLKSQRAKQAKALRLLRSLAK